jgi:hypothetical protein
VAEAKEAVIVHLNDPVQQYPCRNHSWRRTSCQRFAGSRARKGRLDSQLADNSVLPHFWRESCRCGSAFLSFVGRKCPAYQARTAVKSKLKLANRAVQLSRYDWFVIVEDDDLFKVEGFERHVQSSWSSDMSAD